MTKEKEQTSSGLTYNQLVIIGFMFVVLVGISFMIKDKNLKISYMMIVTLGLFTLFNISMTIKFYTKLRNAVGKQGPEGPKGHYGSQGEPGMCTFSEKCGIDDAKNQVIKEIENRGTYKEIMKKDYPIFINYLKGNVDKKDVTDIMKETKKLVDEIIIQEKQTKIEKTDFFNLVF